MLQDLKAGKAAIVLQDKLEQRIELEKRRSKLLELNVETSSAIAEQWRKAAETQGKALQQKKSFWRSPVLWFAVGVVISSISFVAAKRLLD